MTFPVLVVDDQYESFRPRLDNIAREGGFVCAYVSEFSLDAILGQVEAMPDGGVLLLDILEDGVESGIRIFRELGSREEWRELQGGVQILFFSSDPTAKRESKIARARRSDVAGYVAKEKVLRGDPEALDLIHKAYEKSRKYTDLGLFRDKKWLQDIRNEYGLIGSLNTKSMEAVWEKVLAAGLNHESVLIQGETGTGKELVAKAIYEVTKKAAIEEGKKPVGARREFIGAKRLIAYNIGSAPTEGNLQYTELFGAYSESASNITKYRKGIFEKADGGTVFLDEIGDAAPIIQVSLLRVLQEKKVLPLGAFDEEDGEKEVRFRLVTASHVDLSAKVQVREGNFRADLYYRLNTILITLPPLRERKDDIHVLVHYFLEELDKEYGRRVPIPQGQENILFERLKRYDWPGNVRQLESAIRSSYAMSFGDELVLTEDVERMLDGDAPTPPLATEDILKGLEHSPRPLPQLAREYGEPTAKTVACAWVERAGRHPNEEDAQKYFGSSRNAVRRWMGDHGVSSPRGKKGKNSRPEDS